MELTRALTLVALWAVAGALLWWGDLPPRLRRGLAESLETSEIHLDVLTNLKRISSHITALVYPILEEEP